MSWKRAAGILSVIATVAALVLSSGPWYAVAPVVVAAALLAAYVRRWVAFTAVVMLAVLAIAVFVTREATWVDMKRPVKYPPPQMFPVLLVGRTESGRVERLVCYFGDLEGAKARYASWSFLLPGNEAGEGEAEGFAPNGHEMWMPAYSMKQLSGGRQRFEVHGSPDDDVMNRSWYVAANQQITPEAYETYGRHDQSAACVSIAIVIVVWLPITIAVIIYVKRRLSGLQNSQA